MKKFFKSKQGKQLITSVFIITAFVFGWFSSNIFKKGISMSFLGITTSTNPDYKYEYNTFKCRPNMMNGDCSDQIRRNFEWLINDLNNKCIIALSTATRPVMQVPKIQAPQPPNVVCKEDLLGGGIKCSPSW